MPNRSSLTTSVEPKVLLLPANRTATATSASVDLRYADDVALLFTVGAQGDTLSGSVKAEFEVQESDDNTTFTAVANADLTNFETGTNVGTAKVIDANAKASMTYRAGYKGNKRYIRVVERRTGAHTTGTPTSVLALLGRTRYQPVA